MHACFITCLYNTYNIIIIISSQWIITMNCMCIADELDPKTVGNDEDSSVAVEQLQGCFDELKQKMQRVNLASNAETVSTTSNPSSHQLKENLHDDSEKEDMLTGIITSNDVSKLQYRKEKAIGRQSLPLIYNVMTNPSIDDHDGEVWK